MDNYIPIHPLGAEQVCANTEFIKLPYHQAARLINLQGVQYKLMNSEVQLYLTPKKVSAALQPKSSLLCGELNLHDKTF